MIQSMRSRKAAMPFIMLTVLIDMMAIGVIIPVLPALVAACLRTFAVVAFSSITCTTSRATRAILPSPPFPASPRRFPRRMRDAACFRLTGLDSVAARRVPGGTRFEVRPVGGLAIAGWATLPCRTAAA